ncbi:MAG: hypothetical protein IPQ07_14920 [Myxococcales bacterium]|nr:hypothetical protein [Myxococcales bacterium]
MDAIVKGTYVPPEEHYPAIDPIAGVIHKAIDPIRPNGSRAARDGAALRGTPAVHETRTAPR